ncbi:MAG TPA: hypothetical protein VJB98_03540 [Candidatus Paceibacterota bacterium]
MQNSKLKTKPRIFKFFVLTFGFALCALSFEFTYAARLYFDPAVTRTEVGKEYRVDLLLDPEGADVNAIEATLKYPSDILSVKGILTSDSIINLWVEAPEASAGEIKFAGIIPGGFSGIIEPSGEGVGPGYVASFVFAPMVPDSGVVTLEDVKVIKADGTGRKVEVTLGRHELYASKEGGAHEPYEYKDESSPSIFTAEIITSPYVHDGEFVLVFDTVDEGTGVDHYEVKEGEDGSFERAVSPYLLKDQSLSSIIYVRAIDVVGNERTVEIRPKNKRTPFSAIIFVPIIIIALFAIWLKRKKLFS